MTRIMKKSAIALSIVIGSILIVNVYSQKVDTTADEAILDNVTKTTIQAFNEGNIEEYVALIADDAVFMPPRTGALVSRDVIQDWYKDIQTRNHFAINILTESTEIHEEFAFQRVVWKGTITSKQGDDPFHHNAMCLNVLRKQADGSWKIWKCIWNRNRNEAASDN